MLINVHAHIYEGMDVHDWFARQHLDKADVTLVFGDADKSGEAMRAFPGRVLAFGVLRGDQDAPELVERYRDCGFRGLKLIAPHRAYDDPSWYPVYEKAAAYGLPILFHTGHLVVQPAQRRGIISRRKMDITRLDAIARAFPELNLIGAHLGNPCYEDACSLLVKHPGIYCDLSGGTVKMLPYSRWRQLLMTSAEPLLRSREETLHRAIADKFVFGTDGDTVTNLLEFHNNLFDAFDFPDETRERILWRNAARMLGIEAELEARAR